MLYIYIGSPGSGMSFYLIHNINLPVLPVTSNAIQNFQTADPINSLDVYDVDGNLLDEFILASFAPKLKFLGA